MLVQVTRVLLVLLALSFGVIAQDDRATISGTVTDATGATVPRANIKAIRVDTNEIKEVKSTSDGHYSIPYLTPGLYNIEVTATGFQTLKRQNIALRVADKLNLTLELTIGNVSETVTVVGQEVIETGSADRGLVFDPIRTQELPLNGRQTYMLLPLTPGVIFTQEVFGPTGFSGTRGWDVNSSYKINGARTGQNLFLLNGAPISSYGGTWQVAPNVEAVQEFKVMTNTYDSQYGRFGGGVVNTTLKSGSNSWHGNVFDYFRNAVFDANYFQNNTTGQARPKHNQHQYGGVFGGPIRKDKDFIFGSFEGWIERIGFPTLQSVAPLALRDGQHFTDFGITIYDPLTTHVCGSKPNETAAFCTVSGTRRTYIRDPFPNNRIPLDRLSPIGQKILSYYPNPTAGLETRLNNNFVNGGNVGRYRYEQPMVRWDHVFGDQDKFYTIFTFQDGSEDRDSTGFGPPAGSGDVGSERRDQNYILAWTHVISPTTLLDVRGSYGRFRSFFPRWTDFSLTAKDIGMSQMIKAPSTELESVPRMQIGDFTGIFGSVGGTLFSRDTDNQWNLAPSLTLTRARHTIRTGFEMIYYARGSVNPGLATGSFNFTSGWTQQFPDVRRNGLDGSSIASLLLGNPGSGFIDWNDSTYQTRPYFAFYVQDDWKVNSRLNLNLGLRYDIQVAWLERFDRRTRGFDITTKNPYSDAVLANWAKLKAEYDAANPNARYPYPAPPKQLTGGYLFAGVNQPRRIYETDWTNIAPRLGLAYRITEKTVLRAGAGIYYQSPTQTGVIAGFNQQTPYTESLDGLTPSSGLTGPYSLINPFPDGLSRAAGSSLGLLTNVGNSVSFDPETFKIPRTYQYSLGFQHELGHGILVEASFAGNYQIYINFGQNINRWSLQDNQKGFEDNTYLNRQLPNPFFGILPRNSNFGSTATLSSQNLLRPNPIFQDVTDNLLQNGHYRSDALQIKVDKRVLGGGGGTGSLIFGVAYTFAKAYEQNHRLNDWNTAEPLIYELDNTDKTHSFSFHGVWDIPVGDGKRFHVSNSVAKAFVDNWKFDWIFTYTNGYPVGWPNLRNSCDTWKAAEQTENQWFNNNKSCYSNFPGFNVRTIPDRFPDIRNPAKPQLNLAFAKSFPFKDRYSFMLRWEAFNITNTPIRPGPDTNFNNATFGQLPKLQNNFPRVMQIAAKFYF